MDGVIGTVDCGPMLIEGTELASVDESWGDEGPVLMYIKKPNIHINMTSIKASTNLLFS